MSGRNGASRPRNIRARELEAQALELRKAGATYQQIADRLGVALSSTQRAVARALERMVVEPATDVRILEVARLDQLLLGLWGAAVKGDTAAVDRALRIMERRASLLGLDAPKVMKVDTEQRIRYIAAQYGLDPELVVQEAQRILAEEAARERSR